MAEHNPNELAGATQPHSESVPDRAREIFPVTFEKDALDFRPRPEDDAEEPDPKASTAPVSVESPQSPTGLEDVSNEDLETSAPPNAARDTNPTSTSSSQTSTTSTPPGSPEPPART